MAETKAEGVGSAIAETSSAADEDRTKSAESSQNSMPDKPDEPDEVELENIDNISSIDKSEDNRDASFEKSTEELIAAGNVEKSGEDIFSNNSGTSSNQNIQPTNPQSDESETLPEIPDESLEQGEQESFPSAFELAQIDRTLDYEYYLNVMTPEEKQKLYDSAPSPQEFLSWVNKLRDEYNAERKGKITDAEVGISFD